MACKDAFDLNISEGYWIVLLWDTLTSHWITFQLNLSIPLRRMLWERIMSLKYNICCFLWFKIIAALMFWFAATSSNLVGYRTHIFICNWYMIEMCLVSQCDFFIFMPVCFSKPFFWGGGSEYSYITTCVLFIPISVCMYKLMYTDMYIHIIYQNLT